MVATTLPEFEGIRTIKDFQAEVEMVMRRHSLDFLDAVLMFCEQTGMEVETAGQLIRSSAKLKALAQSEAQTMNYLPKSAQLPLSDDE